MKDKKIFAIIAALLLLIVSCSDDDSFTASPGNLLTFSTDTVRLDTLFSNVPSAHRSFWVYNHSGDGLRCSSIRLERGGDSGFRVNVDGIHLGEGSNWQANEVEIRNKDSVRVFVEVTLPRATTAEPQKQEDNLVFTLESGVEQRVNLNAWAWNARLLRNVRISKDSTINASGEPTVIYGGLRVDSGATLTIAAGSKLYFHSDAGMDIYGRLISQGTAEANVTLRGDRIDHMFDYLPYDRVPAQWIGLHLHESSYGNELNYTDLHSSNTGIEIDSSDISRQKLTLSHSTVHNCQGYGIYADHSKLTLQNTQVTNTLHDCMFANGGDVEVNNCTFAQFYLFDGQRGAAFAFADARPLTRLNVLNSLITGYADDELMRSIKDTTATVNYLFDHCMIRTPKITTGDSIHFTNVWYEDVHDDKTMGEKHFKKFDTDNLIYDFALDSVSAAIDKADPKTALPDDRLGIKRDDKPDLGAYEYVKSVDKN